MPLMYKETKKKLRLLIYYFIKHCRFLGKVKLMIKFTSFLAKVMKPPRFSITRQEETLNRYSKYFNRSNSFVLKIETTI